ncbi:putative F-box protein At3g49520 [Humulus lupulus]|uniref:putative F-box protein At3g49520 n=1 Tax=Humulus lupulus TaxID=3486 RepID=UPI002B40994B|nr:putative F-box protein At3g49520 [Humulus lupulus]
MVSFCNLPSDIVEKIMLWVPADSLVQLKFVNKFWYSHMSAFINNPEFVAKHLLITKIQSSLSLLCFGRPSPHIDHRLVTYPLFTIIYDDDDDDDDDDENDHFITVTEALSIPLLDLNKWDKMYHCDGLILLVNNDLGTMVLCNPALKESMILPEPKNVQIEAYPDIGFELDSKNNKYKCVAIWCGYKECQVQVYTVGSDSWREINMSQELCYGLCWGDFEALGVEDWALKSYDLRLTVWNDSVVMPLAPYYNKNSLFIFTMDEAVVGACSWTKYGQVGPLEKYNHGFLPFWWNDEILMEVFDDDRSVRQLALTRIMKLHLKTNW